jgi:hypothetical protein
MTGPAQDPYEQRIHVENGIAYGVAGADLHVWGDGRPPLFVLENWRDQAAASTGRTADLDKLHQWRDDDASLAMRWLHGPQGSGKTRLAATFASESSASNWKVLVAASWPGTAPEGQDLRLGKADGVLLIVDCADRWPASSLALLLTNALFRRRPDRRTRARVLLIGTAADDWPGLRHKLSPDQPALSSQRLDAQQGDRLRQLAALPRRYRGRASGMPDRRYPPRSVRYTSAVPGPGPRLAHGLMYPDRPRVYLPYTRSGVSPGQMPFVQPAAEPARRGSGPRMAHKPSRRFP